MGLITKNTTGKKLKTKQNKTIKNQTRTQIRTLIANRSVYLLLPFILTSTGFCVGGLSYLNYCI